MKIFIYCKIFNGKFFKLTIAFKRGMKQTAIIEMPVFSITLLYLTMLAVCKVPCVFQTSITKILYTIKNTGILILYSEKNILLCLMSKLQ